MDQAHNADAPITPAKAPKGIQSVEIAFRLLQPFLDAPGPYTLKTLADAAGMSSTKAYFYLTSLMRVGLIRRSGTAGVFSLGIAALHLGLAALAEIDVTEAAHEPLMQLRDTLQTSVFLSVWAQEGATVVLHLQGRRARTWQMSLGAVLSPLTATGRAFMAYRAQAEQIATFDRALAAAEPDDGYAGTGTAHWLELCRQIRRTGISPGSGAVVPGFTSLAAAVLDHQGDVAAVVTVIGDVKRFDPALDGANARALLDTVGEISQAIGGGTRTAARRMKPEP